MIRVTNNMLVNDLRRNLNTNMRYMDIYQRQLATGRKINLPSDNPAGLVKSLRLRTNLTEGAQYINNIGEAINFMETTDSALNNIGQIIHRVRELTVKASNTAVNDSGALQSIADEIKELNDQLKMIANTTYGTKHVFAGSNITEPPYQEGANPTPPEDWVGNNNKVELEIAIGVKMPINLTDEDMNFFFTNVMGVDEEGNDIIEKRGIFALLDKIVQDIEDTANGVEGANSIDENITLLDAKMEDLLSSRSKIGAKVNRLELQKSRLESTQISYTSLLAQNEDADMAEVIMQLKMQENVYRASLAAGARIIQPSLIDFLR
ncbi:MAG: flagellar hook-associated protein FlgL [Syntrophomonadaceae bacterium]|nr:flagellar hook-associated protein FlgL [Syntrophomonadaceae bacterium]